MNFVKEIEILKKLVVNYQNITSMAYSTLWRYIALVDFRDVYVPLLC